MSISKVIGAISGFNEFGNFFQLVSSAISSLHSRWGGSQKQIRQDDLSHLQSDLKHLRDTLPAMYDLINRAEWRSHEHCVAELLTKLKDATHDADDLLDEFGWYEKKAQVEGNASQSSCIDFFDTVTQGSYSKLKDVQERLDRLSGQLEKMGLHQVTQRFDKLVRPETSSLPNETKIFGRDEVMKKVMGLLNVPTISKRKRTSSPVHASTSASPSNQVGNESRISSLAVLPILGIGGVGKTTLAQHICSHQRVKSHFELVIWICVSDDFDVKRLTKEVMQSFPGKEATTTLDLLQDALRKHVKNKRFLIVLDDMWDDAMKENGQRWKRFCAPFKSVKEGSMMLVTTRCPKVMEGVRTMEPIILEGLKDDVFWNFFKLCVFGSESSNNDPELEHIGTRILPKLKGSPLAAKTIGRMLRMDLQASHWNSIVESELWELRQEETDILPALRLSYMYLPFYLKQCFSFCAVYPKDYKFEKEYLAEIWVAEGFVKPQGDVPIQDIGCQYFDELLTRSFFQRVRGQYVIHDLLHDMAQKVSEDDCFILRNKSDFDKVPPNVRHLYVLPGSEFDNSDLLSLRKYTKLRTLFCKKQLGKKTGSVMDHWCTELLRMRVISCASTNEVPDSIGKLKHLRYLQISRACPFKSIPSTFCGLYNLQIFYAKKCKLESLPSEFAKLISLQKLVLDGFQYGPGRFPRYFNAADGQEQEIRLLKNLNQFRGHLRILNVGMLSKENAAEAQLKNKKYLDELTLDWSSISHGYQISQNNPVEVLQVLRPPNCLKYLSLHNYPGVSLPSWFQPQNLPGINSDFIGIFLSLTDLTIKGCQNLSSLEHSLCPDNVRAIKKIRIDSCEMLESVPTKRFGDLNFLEELEVRGCPNIRSRSLVSRSLKKLRLGSCGNLLDIIECCSLTHFDLSCHIVTSIQLQMWSLPDLRELSINCHSVTSIGVPISTDLVFCAGTGRVRPLSSLYLLKIEGCVKLSTLDNLLTEEYLPVIEKIEVRHCPSLNWQRGFVFPSSLHSLVLHNFGDISPCVPSCLQNLTSLVLLRLITCQGIQSIPGDIWRSNLASLDVLNIWFCPDLVSIGGAEAVAKIKYVDICNCPNLEEAEEIMNRNRQERRKRRTE